MGRELRKGNRREGKGRKERRVKREKKRRGEGGGYE
jgi:hypothetical protein